MKALWAFQWVSPTNVTLRGGSKNGSQRPHSGGASDAGRKEGSGQQITAPREALFLPLLGRGEALISRAEEGTDPREEKV